MINRLKICSFRLTIEHSWHDGHSTSVGARVGFKSLRENFAHIYT